MSDNLKDLAKYLKQKVSHLKENSSTGGLNTSVSQISEPNFINRSIKINQH